jgi:hypothetical protein
VHASSTFHWKGMARERHNTSLDVNTLGSACVPARQGARRQTSTLSITSSTRTEGLCEPEGP